MLLTISMILPASAMTVPEPRTLGTTLYVGGSGPGNYTKIQDAINNATNGDTVFVYDDSAPYRETLLINASINLIGENMDTTIIQNATNNTPVITVQANGITISGFFIKDLSTNSNGYPNALNANLKNSTIQHCKILVTIFDGDGITVTGCHNTITDNVVIKAFNGIAINGCNNTITNNHVNHTQNGIYVNHGCHNTITGNICTNNGNGMWIGSSRNNLIQDNHFDGDGMYAGLTMWLSYHNTITLNSFANNKEKGVNILDSGNNTFSQNNFINNTLNADFRRETGFEHQSLLKLALLKLLHPGEQIIYRAFANNTWTSNYWNGNTTTPHDIPGIIIYLPRLNEIVSRHMHSTANIGVLHIHNYDYTPAQTPYEIP